MRMARVLGIGLIVAVPILALGAFLWLFIGPYSFSPFPKRTIASVFDGQTNPLENPNIEFVCPGFDCAEVLPRLPAATSFSCPQDIGFLAACCNTKFSGVAGTEVHIYWRGFGKYRLVLDPPWCRDPEFDSSAGPETSQAKEWIRCDELWERIESGDSRLPDARPAIRSQESS